MIAGITGTVTAVLEDRLRVDMGAMVIEVFMPRISCQRVREGQEIRLHTQLYLEGSGASGRLTPVLIGFETEEDRRFFDQITTVKGMGARKALRAWMLPLSQWANAIESGDERTLKSLPEIGATMAKRLVAELKGKVDLFAVQGDITVQTEQDDDLVADALSVLVQLGYRRVDAERIVDKVLRKWEGEPGDSEELVRRVLRSIG